MEPWLIALIVKPLALLFLFCVIVIPIELIIAKIFPDGRLKDVLYDRTFRDRRPALFMFWWFVLVGSLVFSIAGMMQWAL